MGKKTSRFRCDRSEFKMNIPDMKHYRSRDSHFELDVPRRWNPFPPGWTNSPSELIRFASEESDSPVLIIFRDPHNPIHSLHEVADRVQQVLARKKCASFTSGETTIGAETVPTLDFDKVQGDVIWSCRYYFVAAETLRYGLGFGTTSNNADVWQLFDRVAKSFKRFHLPC
jgi:hypothetical protein